MSVLHCLISYDELYSLKTYLGFYYKVFNEPYVLVMWGFSLNIATGETLQDITYFPILTSFAIITRYVGEVCILWMHFIISSSYHISLHFDLKSKVLIFKNLVKTQVIVKYPLKGARHYDGHGDHLWV